MADRKIIHVDMDAFYASVEQRDNPELKGKPIAVGGGSRRGVITTASYEARPFGIRSAMPGFKAKAKCPDLIFVKPRFEAYVEVSKQIRAVFATYTDIIEPLSLDEAFLDVTNCKKDIIYATDIAKAIKADILSETQLTASAGVSYCKFIAKIASDMNKPNGLTVIKPKQAISFLESLPVEKFFGVGKVTAAKMKSKGIHTGKDLKEWSQYDLIKSFGKSGPFFYNIVRGIDERPVKAERERKSLGIERTFEDPISDLVQLQQKLDVIVEGFMKRLEKSNAYGRTLTLKLKTAEFKNVTRSISKRTPLKDRTLIEQLAKDLLSQHHEEGMKIRLMGLTASNFIDEEKDNQLQIDFN